MSDRPRRLYPQELAKISQAVHPPIGSCSADDLDEPGVTIVMLSYERFHLTRRTIDSIYKNTSYPFNILVFDNGSSPGTVSKLRDLSTGYGNMLVYYNPDNLGASEGRNRAFEMVGSEYVVSLDNDILCSPGWLMETMRTAVLFEASFVAPMRLDVGGNVWSHAAELVYTDNGDVLEIARWFHDLPPGYIRSLLNGKSIPTNFLPGGAGLYKVSAFSDCGGFDPALRHFEDLEFSLRVTEEGYKIWTSQDAMLTHDDEWIPVSEPDRDYVLKHYDPGKLRKSAAYFKSKWGVDVFPEKYEVAFRNRLSSKLEEKSNG